MQNIVPLGGLTLYQAISLVMSNAAYVQEYRECIHLIGNLLSLKLKAPCTGYVRYPYKDNYLYHLF